MDKKVILGLGVLGVAGLSYLYLTNKNKATSELKASQDTNALQDVKLSAEDKKRQEELSLITDTERKKLYDEIYLATVEIVKTNATNRVQVQQYAMQQREAMQEEMRRSKIFETTEDAGIYFSQFNEVLKGSVMPTISEINEAALEYFNCTLEELNKMSVDELKFVLELTKDKQKLVDDPFSFRKVVDFMKKYPRISRMIMQNGDLSPCDAEKENMRFKKPTLIMSDYYYADAYEV